MYMHRMVLRQGSEVEQGRMSGIRMFAVMHVYMCPLSIAPVFPNVVILL